MDKRATEHKAKLDAAFTLLTQETTTFEKFDHIRSLIKGIHPDIDKHLATCSDAIKQLKKVQKGDIISLSAEALSEDTQEQKKRKKALLFFISCWKDLNAEVKRIQDLYNQQQAEGKTSQNHHVSTLGKVFTFAKGPLGLITLAALGIVGASLYIKSSFVTITIKNSGCSPITPIVKLPVSIPGIKLPTNTIADGGQDTASVPPLSVIVDGTKTSKMIAARTDRTAN